MEYAARQPLGLWRVHVLVLNCGSSSLKFQVVDTDLERIEQDSDRTLARGVIERIGSEALIRVAVEGKRAQRSATAMRDHRAALDWVLRWLVDPATKLPGIHALADLSAVGHRVVHGGEQLVHSVVIDEEVEDRIEDCIDLAPLHNPANLKGVRAARELLGAGIPQVAVFDTSFHSTMPESAYLYALPYSLYVRHRLRRYGFHGTSHRYLAYRYRRLTGRTLEQTKIVTLHLGNGCSACAIRGGASVETSMGLTPLEGLVMGTRSGDLDPSVLEFLHHKEGLSLAEIDMLLNKQSGLLGISGLTSDMRELLREENEHQDRRAKLAIDVFCARVKHYLGGYLAKLNGADAIVFSGGIGENSAEIRRRICKDLDFLGIRLDEARNDQLAPGAEGQISADGARIELWVVPTNEELLIARDTVRCVCDAPRRW